MNTVAPVLEDITGGTYDMNVGYGVMIGRGLPIAPETNRLPTSGVQRTSLGFGTGFRLNRSFTWRVY